MTILTISTTLNVSFGVLSWFKCFLNKYLPREENIFDQESQSQSEFEYVPYQINIASPVDICLRRRDH